MIDLIVKQLQSNHVSDWRILERKVDGVELFFIKDSLDMNRAKRVHKFFVTLYNDFKADGKLYRGSSDFTIYPDMKQEEIESLIKENLLFSKFVKNPYYPIAEPIKSSQKVLDPIDLSMALNRIVNDFPFKFEKVWMNSSEFFLNHVQERIVNSKGVDVFNDLYKLYIEIITSAKVTEEVELYWDFERAYPSEIKDEILQAMISTQERANATFTPQVEDFPVILSGESVSEFFKYPLYKTSALYLYEHLSDSKVGSKILNDDITMWIDPHVEGSAYSLDYDEDGFLCKKVKIVENSVVKNIWGDVRYAYYLGIEPTGHLTNFTVEAGYESEKTFENDKYIKILSFSDFQMDPVTGDFGGEIRLGWYSDGKDRRPITGGSVSGNITKCSFKLSSESQLIGNFKGPKSVKIIGAQIGGKQ